MALVKGTNCGFVTVAPSADPDASDYSVFDGESNALKDTSPVGAIKVTEIGWWCHNATQEGNFEVGIYDHNGGDNNPENLLAGASQTNAKGTTAGWKKVTGLNIPITAETIYWIAAQLDALVAQTEIDLVEDASEKTDIKELSITLTDPWGVSTAEVGYLTAIYAVWEAAPPPPTFALTVTAGANGSASDETGTSPYEESAVVDILATPDENYHFVNWTTGDGGSFDNANAEDTNYNMPGNPAEVTANFELTPIPPNPNKGTKSTKEIAKINIPEGIGDVQNLVPEESHVLSKERVGLEL